MSLYASGLAVVIAITAGYLIYVLLVKWTQHPSTGNHHQPGSPNPQITLSTPPTSPLAAPASALTSRPASGFSASLSGSRPGTPLDAAAGEFGGAAMFASAAASLGLPAQLICNTPLVPDSDRAPETCDWLLRLARVVMHGAAASRELSGCALLVLNAMLKDLQARGMDSAVMFVHDMQLGSTQPVISSIQWLKRADGIAWDSQGFDVSLSYTAPDASLATASSDLKIQMSAALPLSAGSLPVATHIVVNVRQFTLPLRFVWRNAAPYQILVSATAEPVLDFEVSLASTGRALAHVGNAFTAHVAKMISAALLWPGQHVVPADGLTSSSLLTTILESCLASQTSSKADEFRLRKFTAIHLDNIRIRVVEAAGLAAKDRNGLSDPYCILTVGPAPDQTFRTRIVRKSLNPRWDEECVLRLTAECRSLTIELFDKDRIGKDDFLGCVVIPLASLPAHSASFTRKFQLGPRAGEDLGDVTGTLTLQFGLDNLDGARKQFLNKPLENTSSSTSLDDASRSPRSHRAVTESSSGLSVASATGLSSTTSMSALSTPTSARPHEGGNSGPTSLAVTPTSSAPSVASMRLPSGLTASTPALSAPSFASTASSSSATPSGKSVPGSQLGLPESSHPFTRNESARSSTKSTNRRSGFFGRRGSDASADSTMSALGSETGSTLDLAELSVALTTEDLGEKKRSYLLYEVSVPTEDNSNVHLIHLVPDKTSGKKAPAKATKLHVCNGHTFVATHFPSKESCAVCNQSLKGSFGKQGYQCRECRTICHKECHRTVASWCSASKVSQIHLSKLE